MKPAYLFFALALFNGGALAGYLVGRQSTPPLATSDWRRGVNDGLECSLEACKTVRGTIAAKVELSPKLGDEDYIKGMLAAADVIEGATKAVLKANSEK